MTVRGGGDTRWAMASTQSEECARRPGALPPKRMVLHGPDPTRVQPNTRLRRDATRPRRAPLRLSVQQTPLPPPSQGRWNFRFRFPSSVEGAGSGSSGAPQPGQALRRTQRPSRSSARRAHHARRKEAAARGSARLRASLDGRCVRRSVRVQAGAEKRRSNRTEKHHARSRKAGRDMA
jgi:hypothetical protein